jgi:diacylglycerol kinase (ATP)
MRIRCPFTGYPLPAATNVRITLIHNPGAGSQAADSAARLVAMLGDAGHAVRQQCATDEDWTKCLDWPADAVAVAGGDGTVARAAKAMVGRGIPLAALPGGTANNISRTLGLLGRHWEQLVREWDGARRQKLDVGVAEGPWGRRYFVEGVGVGLFGSTVPVEEGKAARPSAATPDDKVKAALQKIRDRLAHTRPVKVEGTLDGKEIRGEYVLFEALNIPYVGPNLFLAPDSACGDGQLDLVMAGEAERERLAHYLETWQEEKARLAVLPSRQGKHLRLRWTGYPVHIDDEFWRGEEQVARDGSAAIDIRVETTVEFLVPAQAAANGK